MDLRATSTPRALRAPQSGGFGDGLQAAFELIATPAVFGLLGYWLDRRFDTVPVFTLVLTFCVLTYAVWRVITGYNADMAAAERGKPWTRSRGGAPEAATDG